MAFTGGDSIAAAARQGVDFAKTTSAVTVALNPSTLLDVAGSPGAGTLAIGNTTTGVVPTDATNGFPLLDAFGVGNTGYITDLSFAGTVAGRMTLKDRLWHAGSVVLTALGTTTFSGMPSYLGRCPDGLGNGLEIWLEINAAVSATATTVAVGYTNIDGVTGRSTGASVSLSGYITRRLVRMPYQAGDNGVQQVTSLTVGGTVATTGSVNVIVARPLIGGMRVPVVGGGDKWAWDKTGLVRVYETSALWPVVTPDSTASGVPEMFITVANG